MKDKLERAKLWYARQLNERPLETITGSLTAVASSVQLLTAIAKFQNAQTWRREVKRREKLHK